MFNQICTGLRPNPSPIEYKIYKLFSFRPVSNDVWNQQRKSTDLGQSSKKFRRNWSGNALHLDATSSMLTAWLRQIRILYSTVFSARGGLGNYVDVIRINAIYAQCTRMHRDVWQCIEIVYFIFDAYWKWSKKIYLKKKIKWENTLKIENRNVIRLICDLIINNFTIKM